MNENRINTEQLKILLALQNISDEAQQWKENEKVDSTSGSTGYEGSYNTQHSDDHWQWPSQQTFAPMRISHAVDILPAEHIPHSRHSGHAWTNRLGAAGMPQVSHVFCSIYRHMSIAYDS